MPGDVLASRSKSPDAAAARFGLLAILFITLTATIAQAGIPQKMNFQAALTTPSGAPLSSATLDLTFEIFDAADPASSTSKWGQESHTAVTTDSAGFVQVILGSSVALNPPVFSHGQSYLEITIDGHSPVSPRTKLVSTPYTYQAARVESVDSAQGGTILSATTIEGKLTVDGMAETTDRINIGGFKMEDGAAAGYVLVSSSTGVGTWTAPDGKYWKVNGNSGLDGSSYIGTNDSVNFRIKFNGNQAFKIRYSEGTTGSWYNNESPSILGGHSTNWVADGVNGATIGGGGYKDESVEVDKPNRVSGDFGTVSGGSNRLLKN